MSYSHQLLQLIVPAMQAEPLSDFLLAHEQVPFFLMLEAVGMGQPHEQLTAEEQVEGGQHKVKFEVELPEDVVRPLLDHMREALPTLTIAYRILPIVEHDLL
jgi:hypothetical protein